MKAYTWVWLTRLLLAFLACASALGTPKRSSCTYSSTDTSAEPRTYESVEQTVKIFAACTMKQGCVRRH